MDLVWDLFSEQAHDVIVLASRQSGKTLNLAVLAHLWCHFWPGVEVAALAAVFDQAFKQFSYLKEILDTDNFKSDTFPVTTRRIKYRNGSLAHILSGTKSGVNSPHPQIATLDEVDLMEWSLLQQAFSMPKSDETHEATLVLASTRKTMIGSMQGLLNRVRNDSYFPFSVYSWNVFTVCERCERPSCDQCRARIRPDGISFYDRCQKKAQWSDGFMYLDDVWKKFSLLDPYEWDMEWECLKAELAGLVFPRFDAENVHANKLFEPRDGWKTYVVCDFGFGPGHPFVAYYCQIDPSDNIWVYAELFGEGIDISVWIERIKEWVSSEDEDAVVLPMFQKIFADGHGDQEIRDMKKAGLKTTRPIFVGVNEGAKMLRKWINGAHDDYVHPAIFIHPQCRHLIDCLGALKFTKSGDVQETDDDPFDAMRYLIKGAGYMDVKVEPEISSLERLRGPASQPPTSSDKWKSLAKTVNRPVRKMQEGRTIPKIPGTRGA
jgi:hypothetical protein